MPTAKINLQQVTQLRNFKIDYTNVRILEYIDENDVQPQSFAQFRALVPPEAFAVQEQSRPAFSSDLKHLVTYTAGAFPKGKVLVVVNATLYPSVKAAIDLYVQDLAYEGYFAVVYKASGGGPVDLRNFLISKQPSVGALLVGALPVAWFEMSDDFNGASEFPCDLYFADLNGQWKDPDGDGKFSEHPDGGIEPEIWIGRLWTPLANGNDAGLINDYFKRNHLYRKGLFGASNKALAYVDDDWTGFDDCALDFMLPAANVEKITDPATTDADRYKGEVQQFRAWAQICVHSSPGGHSFKVPGAASEWVPNTYLRDVNPPMPFSTISLPAATPCSPNRTTWQVGTSLTRVAAPHAMAWPLLAAPRPARC